MERCIQRACGLLAGLWAGAAAAATTCDALRAEIEAKVAASGVARFAVTVVEADTPEQGRVVGSCDMGRRKIVYRQESVPAPLAGAGNGPPMLTECRDGRVSLGGSCRP